MDIYGLYLSKCILLQTALLPSSHCCHVVLRTGEVVSGCTWLSAVSPLVIQRWNCIDSHCIGHYAQRNAQLHISSASCRQIDLADYLFSRIFPSSALCFSSWFIQNNEQCAFVDQFCLDRKSGGTFEKAWKSGGTFSRSSFTLVFCSLVFWGSGQYSQSITNLQSPKFLWNIYYYSIDHD